MFILFSTEQALLIMQANSSVVNLGAGSVPLDTSLKI